MFSLTSPTQVNDGANRETVAFILFFFFFEQWQWFLNVPFQLLRKDEGDKANALTSPPMTPSSEQRKVLITASYLSSFKYLDWCLKPGRDLNSRPPAQQTSPQTFWCSIVISFGLSFILYDSFLFQFGGVWKLQ